MNKKGFISLILAVTIVFSIMTVGFADTSQLAAKQELNINIYQEPYTLDFQLCTSSGEMEIYNWIMEGLTRNSGGKIKAGMAQKWDISKDGKTWTFHLRDAYWTDGKKVTASDFVSGWLRALDPDVATEYAYIMFDIVGAEDYYNGKGSADKVGIRAIDDKTLEVKLKNPVPYFDYLVSMPVYSPFRADIYLNLGDNYNSEADYLVTNGPFILQSWIHDEGMVFVKNQAYWDPTSIKLEKINAYMVEDSTTELSMYQMGELDLTTSLDSEQKKLVPKEEVKSYTDGSVWYFDFNCKDKVLKNKNIRKALTLAIDRNKFIQDIGRTEWKPALALVQPDIINDADGKTFRSKKTAFFKDNDVKTAKALLAQGLKELKLKKLPELLLLINDTETATLYGKEFKDMWKKNLGIDVALEPVPAVERIEMQRNHQYQISLAGWGPDYPDAMTDLDMFVTGYGLNDVAYSNPKYDALIKTAKAQADKKKRSEILHQAEQMLMDDMPVGPIYYRYRNYSVKNYVKGLTRNSLGADIDLVYSYIEGKK